MLELATSAEVRPARLHAVAGRSWTTSRCWVRCSSTSLSVGLTAPASSSARPAGVVDLDTAMLLYEGTSMGGVLGAAVVALTPELDGAFLQVPGAGIADIIMNSLLWPLFMGVCPTAPSTGRCRTRSWVRRACSSTHRQRPTSWTASPRPARPVFVRYGVGDAVVPTSTTDRLVHQLGLPQGRSASSPRSRHRQAGETIPADGTRVRGGVVVELDASCSRSPPTCRSASRRSVQLLDGVARRTSRRRGRHRLIATPLS